MRTRHRVLSAAAVLCIIAVLWVAAVPSVVAGESAGSDVDTAGAADLLEQDTPVQTPGTASGDSSVDTAMFYLAIVVGGLAVLGLAVAYRRRVADVSPEDRVDLFDRDVLRLFLVLCAVEIASGILSGYPVFFGLVTAPLVRAVGCNTLACGALVAVPVDVLVVYLVAVLGAPLVRSVRRRLGQ